LNHDIHGRITGWRITLIKSILCTLCGLLLWLALIAQAHAADVPLVVAAHPHSPKNLDPTLFPNSELTLISSQELDTLVNQALQTFYTPGAAVAIVHDGKIVHAKGYGKRHIEDDLAVNQYTYFRIASTTKAFTAATMAILVDEGKIAWNDKVSDHLPEFKLSNPYVTAEFTILDLFTHRSGLVGGAGDSMLWPEPSGFTRKELIHNLRHLTPAYSFRSTYAYSNVMYITAAEIVAKISGMPWSQFLHKHIFSPLNIQCYGGAMPNTALANVALSYGHDDERGIYAIPRNGIYGSEILSAAAGGVVCNAQGMAVWLQALLNDAMTVKGEALFSTEQLEEMFTSQIPLYISTHAKQTHRTHFKSYAIGWRKENIYGYEMISHTGTLSGYQAYVAMIPELSLGVVVLNNGSNYGVRSAIMQAVIKSVMPESPDIDWVQHYVDYQDEQEARYLACLLPDPIGSGIMLLPVENYLGTYNDKWFGKITLWENAQGTLRFKSQKMPTLKGDLEAFGEHSWLVRWDNQNAASDAFIHFDVRPDHSIKGLSMYPYTAKDIVNHEYRDMYFTPWSENVIPIVQGVE
jgi:CubicO group peptidase (beta-lactamase class C family)